MQSVGRTIPSRVYIPEKTIRIPLCGLVDVSGMLPILNHLVLQLLLERKQLGLAFKVFPGATHTRLEHSLGTLQITRKVIQHFGITDESLVHALEAAALIHDIGHGPFSHEFEIVAPHDHKVQGWHRFEQLRECIATYADVALVEQIYLRQNFVDLIEKQAVNIIGPDPCDIGGLAELKWVAEYADLHGILMAPHGTADGLIGLAALVQVCATLPGNYIAFEYPTGKPEWWYEIVDGLPNPIVVDSFIEVWDRPGMGIDLNEKAARKHLREEDGDFFD